MHKTKREAAAGGRVFNEANGDGQHLIALAQKLARDAEHHALLSASLASQADRLMHAGLERLQSQQATPKSC